jgi:hypothetical protein
MSQMTSQSSGNSSQCGSPSPGPSAPCGDAQKAPILAADIDTDLSAIQANADLLGHDLADVSIGLGVVGDVLGLADTGLGLVDAGTGLVDSLLCDTV